MSNEQQDTAELKRFLHEVGRLAQDSETLMRAVDTMTPYMPAGVKASAKVSTDSLRAAIQRVNYMRKQLREKIGGEASER